MFYRSEKFKNIPQKCFSYVPTEAELNSKYQRRKTFLIWLTIK